MPSLKEKSHFHATQEIPITYSPHKITEYVSNRTGMRVVVVDQEGPKVLGFFAAATEITDDSGSPHTLEHLCFMGSKSYPYKGLLDKLATRAYSTTNAWTATDHTAYTVETAGYAAFAQLLPVYLEHVILPTLTDEGCYTEVHHVNGEGHDAGVVYSEMQGVQNQQQELMELRSKRLMYQEDIGFRYETGGMMEQLRVLTADRIRRFHRDMYQPKNLCVTIVGKIDHDHLLSTLDDFEGTILQDIPKPDAPFKRPWIDSPQPKDLPKSIRETVEFPEEDESMGEVSIKYFGPHCEDIVATTALTVLLSYLAGSSASVLENVLVEKEQLASAVIFYPTPRPNTVIEFALSGVDAKKLEEVEGRFHELLKETADKELDMPFMTDCIDRERRQQMLQAESSERHYTWSIITTFLFSESRDMSYLAHLKEFDELRRWSDSDWRAFMSKWLVDNRFVTILGQPSAALSKKLKDEEEARVAAQIEKLGEDGLKKLEKKLEHAKAFNDREIPKEILEKFKVPGTDTIHFITTTPARSGAAKKDLGVPENKIQHVINNDKTDLPLFIQFEHVPSNFVTIHLLICTSNIPVSLRPLLSIYLENFFTTPISRDGKRVEFEQVIMELLRDTADYSIDSGGQLGNGEVLDINLKVEAAKYAKAIDWIKDLLWNSIFDVERIQATTVRLLADVPEEKRDASEMSDAVSTMINDAPGSLNRARSTLVKALYLKRLKKLLSTEPDTVISHLEELRNAIAQLSNFRVLVVADVEKLERPVSAWDAMAQGHDASKPLLPLDKRIDRLSDAGKNPGKLSYIVPMPTSDSSFLLADAKGPEHSREPGVPALMVAIAYLDAVEGPMWTAIRGTGLAYGTGFSRRVGQLQFSVYRSPDAFKAYSTAKKVLEEFISGRTVFDALALEGAVSSIVLTLASQQATMGESAVDKFVLEVIKGLPREWNDVILEKVRAVTVEEIKVAMREKLLPLFEAASSNVVVTCAPIMEQSLVKGLKDMGFSPEVQSLAHFQEDYGLKAGDEDADDDEDEDDEDEDEEDDDDDDDEESEDDK